MVALKRRPMTVDEDDTFDQEVFDRRHWPRRVYRDGHGPHVRLTLTDAASRPRPLMDARMIEHQRLLDHYARLGAASAHNNRPHAARLTDADMRKREAARQATIVEMRDAWKQPFGDGRLRFAGIDPNGDHDQDDDGDDDDSDPVEQARQAYIWRVSNDWRTNPAAAANRTEALRRGTMAEDAAVDRDAAYREYCQRICNDWKR
jgi:hypothetical protein